MTDAMPESMREVVIGFPVEDRYLRRLTERFPDIAFRSVEREHLSRDAANADAIVCWQPLTDDDLRATKRLRWVHRGGAGVEDLLTPAFRQRDLMLTNSSGVHAPNIAEHVLAMMLAFARGLPSLLDAQRRHCWRDDDTRREVFELGGQTLLLVGYGEIGRALATRARALGMRCLAVRRTVEADPDASVERLAPVSDLHELLPLADHVANSLPHTGSTRGLFDVSAFGAMKPGAYFYNVGRGPTVVTDDLIAALEAGQIAGAGLDVVDPEPLPPDSPLWDRRDVMITAHTAGATPHMWDRIFALVEENIARFQAGRPLLNVVDQDRGY